MTTVTATTEPLVIEYRGTITVPPSVLDAGPSAPDIGAMLTGLAPALSTAILTLLGDAPGATYTVHLDVTGGAAVELAPDAPT